MSPYPVLHEADCLERSNRLTVPFRLRLAIPHSPAIGKRHAPRASAPPAGPLPAPAPAPGGASS